MKMLNHRRRIDQVVVIDHRRLKCDHDNPELGLLDQFKNGLPVRKPVNRVFFKLISDCF
jgi:hypothetical protein